MAVSVTLWPGAVAAQSPTPDEMVVTRSDGSLSIFPLSTVRRIDPSTSTFVVRLLDGSHIDFPFSSIRNIRFDATSTTDVAPGATSMSAPRLLLAYPNPAGRFSTVPFALSHRDQVTLCVYSVTGQCVRTLARGEFTPGTHEAVWDGTDDHGHRVRGGIYFLKLRGASETRRVILLP